jgi:CBS domain containing-hemolysin-like protein
VLEQIGRIPAENEVISVNEFDIVVKSMDGNRIREYIVRPTAKVAGSPSGELPDASA